MPNSSARRLAVCVAVLAGLAQAASAAEILIADAKSQPESLTVAPGGILFVGSASTPFVYKVKPGSTTAEKFVDASAGRCRHLLLRHACRCCHQHVVDVPADPGAGHDAGAAPYRAERVSISPPAPRRSAGTCRMTTVSATISRSDRTRRCTSPTPPTARSSGCRPVRPPPNCSWSIARSTASTASRFWTARST